MSSVIFAFGSAGWMEMFIVGLVALLLFGNRVPTIMRSLGSSVIEFKKGVKGVDDDDEDAAPQKGSSDASSNKTHA